MSQKTKQKNKTEALSASLSWTDHAWADYLYWQEADLNKLRAINRLLEDCKRDPFKGLGKPEPLKGCLTGFWSRRIDHEHRLVYAFEAGVIYVVACRYHYR
jgi:toxin YoeB